MSTKELWIQYFGDLEGYCKTSELFDSFRPDIMLIKGDTIYILELTVVLKPNKVVVCCW